MRKPKKLLSLLTAAALCVSYTVPAAALAAAGDGMSSIDTAVAEVTMTTYDGLTWHQEYTDLLEAFSAARLGKFGDEPNAHYADDVAVKLLESDKTYTLESSENYPINFEYNHGVTVDLNGCALKRTVTEYQQGIISVKDSANVTLENGTLEFEVSIYNYPSAIKLPGSGNPTLTLKDMAVNVTGTEKGSGGIYGGYAIYAQGGGTLNIESGNYDRVWINQVSARLSGGSYEAIELDGNNYASLLEEGYIFASAGDSYIDPSAMKYNESINEWENAQNIKVVRCTHSGNFTDGICDRCGFACLHETVEGDACAICKMQMAAKDSSGSYYAELADAINSVAAGGTVTMLKDADNATISSSLKLDCNGHTIGTLAIGDGVKLDDLLPDGYAFKSGDTWINDESGRTLINVTTAEIPVKSVVADNPTITVKYGEPYTLRTTFAWIGDSSSSNNRIKWEYADGSYIHEQAPTLTGYDNNTRTMDYTFSLTGRYPAKPGTYTYVVTFTKDGYSKSCEFTVTIEKADPSVTKTPRAIEGLVYNGSVQALIEAGAASGGALQYSLAQDGTYSAEIPTATNAGEYTVWYKVAGDSNHNDSAPASVKVTIAKASPTCDAPAGATATYGQKLGDVLLANPDGNTPGTWTWVDDTQNVGDADSNTFKATFTPNDTVNYKTVADVDVTVAVNKADGSVVAPKAKTLAYNGKDQELVEAATSNTGTVQYKLDGGDWSAVIPTAKSAGNYTVWYKVEGDKNHKDVSEQSIEVSIAKAAVTVAAKDRNVSVGEKAPDLSVPDLNRDYTVTGLFGGDMLITAPSLKYADADGNDLAEPDTSKAGEAARVIANGADAGENYSVFYVEGKLTVSVPYTPSPTPTPTPNPKPDPNPNPNPEPGQPGDPGTPDQPDTPQTPAKGDSVTAGSGNAQLNFTVTGVAGASGKGSYVSFTGCPKNAKKVTVPASIKINGTSYDVTEIASDAFKDRKGLTKVVIPDSVSSIGKGAFRGCENLKSITLGGGLKSIGKEAFKGCKNLRTITVTSKQLSKKSVKNCLKGSKVETIIVQVGSKKANKKAADKYGPFFAKKNAGKKASVKPSKKPLKK